MYHGLRVAWKLGYRKVVCFFDSMLAIGLVCAPPQQFHVFAVLIRNICDLVKRSWKVRIEHILCEGNSSADFLAKVDVRQELDFLLVQDPPPGIEGLLLADSKGSVVVRQ